MRIKKTFWYGSSAFLLILGFAAYRNENIISLISALFFLIWIVQIPGTLILALTQNKNSSLFRILLFGHIVGLTFYPVLYYVLFYLNHWQDFITVISIINFILIS